MAQEAPQSLSAPVVALPKGGGAIRGLGEKFGGNPATGTGSLSVPIAVSPGRSGFGPELSLSYDSGAGNGPFGFGWSLSLPSITRKTDKGLPRYCDGEESDVFILSGSEDLVPVLTAEGVRFEDSVSVGGETFTVHRYRPRVEGLFARIERWTRQGDGDAHWRSLSRDNILTLYGLDPGSRVADPHDPSRAFSWLICETRDDRGNAIVYEYRAEDDEGVELSSAHERNRSSETRSANRYLKRVRYGNRKPLLDLDGGRPPLLPQVMRTAAEWLFEVVLDYDEGHLQTLPLDPNMSAAEQHRYVRASASPGQTWAVRPDPFSSYRAAFEVRTYRRCRRVLMFHRFDELGPDPYLVRSTEFDYEGSTPVASFIRAVRQSGYVRDDAKKAYLQKALPALELTYTEALIDERVHELDPSSFENLPAGLADRGEQWVDLDGEGVPGFLAEESGAWFYKPSLGGGRFAPLQRVAERPSLSAAGRQQLLDLGGDGRLDLVDFSGPTPGYYERNGGEGWEAFRPFESLPNVAWDDPNLRFVDLTGDALADVLVTGNDALTWYPLLGEVQGFGPAERVPIATDEERGPRVLLADGTQTVQLADLSGDGLPDLVRIRNGEICYWPNLGYGRFGPRVTMDNAPWFDAGDQFDPRRVRLADIDGSGTTDVIYLGRDTVQLYFNQCGNAWADDRPLASLPLADDTASVAAIDLLGNGTACLVWSSPLPGTERPLRYVDLMGGQKPHLLVGVANNLGAETRVEYAASTTFSLADKAAGTPWLTRLPFPVHVVERVETFDYVSRNRFVTRYAYHDGCYDGKEREFRGFGFVEQWDTEQFAALSDSGAFPTGDNVDQASHVPPVHTKTWFHTGIVGGLVDECVLPDGLTADEEREARRSLKGRMLRQETYGLDGTDKEANPYVVSTSSYAVRLEQPTGPNRHAVFLAHPREALSNHSERHPSDPRIGHKLTLEVDAFGNVLKEATVGYGRAKPDLTLSPEDQAKQGKTLVTYTENRVTNVVDTASGYRTPAPSETSTYELTGYTPTGAAGRFQASDFGAFDSELPYEASPTKGRQRRLIERARTFYRKDDLTGLLPLDTVEELALPGQSYRLAFTPGLIAHVFQRDGKPLLAKPATVLGADGGYVDLDGDGHWWTPTGRAFLSLDGSHTPTQELAYGRTHFFQPLRFVDVFGHTTTVSLDTYDLLLQDSVDPVGNRITVGERDKKGALTLSGIDYRVLQPSVVMDANRNRARVTFDALGLVVGTAAQGKPEEKLGDSLDAFTADLTDAQVAGHFADPLAAPNALLVRATTRLVYDLATQPAAVCTLARETHDADLKQNEQTKVQQTFSYSDGFGREIQKKARAEPAADQKPRWVGSGWTVFNNKGKPVRQYEPFFTATHAFEFDVKAGVSPVLFYDPVERVVGTLHANHTWEKVVLGPWRQETWDVNDTVLIADPTTDGDLGACFQRIPNTDYEPSWHTQRAGGALGPREQEAAAKTAIHAETPTIAHSDTLGRTFLTIAHNRFERKGIVEQQYATRTDLDVEGNRRAVSDPLGRVVLRHEHDLLGRSIHQSSMEAGERWTLGDATDKPIRAWDSRGHTLRTAYDEARRPTGTFVQEEGAPEIGAQKAVYGEAQGDSKNLRGRLYRQFDQAGVVTNDAYDFKGNLVASRRQLAVDYKQSLDWSGAPGLESEVFSASTELDALDRPVYVRAPDKSVLQLNYNEANLVESLQVGVRGDKPTTFVADIDYDARARRERVVYGNGIVTTYEFDPLTANLSKLETKRGSDLLQELSYAWDPVGNVISIHDGAQQTAYFKNAVVEPHNDYVYDAVYRLIGASGREHVGQTPSSWNDASQVNLAHPGDGQAMRRYAETYDYDGAGNLIQLAHQATSGSWARSYSYAEASLLNGADVNNRLSSTSVGQISEAYAYDAHGNLTTMSQLPLMAWDVRDQLHSTTRQVRNDGGMPETTWYVYDASGQRVRKVTDRQAGKGETPSRMRERVYIGGFEVYREYGADGEAVVLERETLHVMDEKERVAFVESRTQGKDGPARLVRYQLANHIGSTSVELDEKAQIISYEEYTPYGSTSYQAVRSQTEAPKRYRYTGKERDEESGLSYHGARYYAPWLGRWTSADPVEHPNLYPYCGDNPVRLHDPDGRQELPPEFYGSQKLLTGTETQEQVAQMFAERGIYYKGSAMWVKTGTGGYWNIQTWQVQARDTGKQLNMRADEAKASVPTPVKTTKPAPTSTASTGPTIKEKREQDWQAGKAGMWNKAVDLMAMAVLPLPLVLTGKADALTQRFKTDAPAATGDRLRDYELQDNYEAGGWFTETVVAAAQMVPWAEMAEGALLAGGKLPVPTGSGLGMAGGQEWIGFSRRWAKEADKLTAAVKQLKIEPVTSKAELDALRKGEQIVRKAGGGDRFARAAQDAGTAVHESMGAADAGQGIDYPGLGELKTHWSGTISMWTLRSGLSQAEKGGVTRILHYLYDPASRSYVKFFVDLGNPKLMRLLR